jgi:hypothetical protein
MMLRQIPSNDLMLFSYGDVSDLVVSISPFAFARGDFLAMWVDVSNCLKGRSGARTRLIPTGRSAPPRPS